MEFAPVARSAQHHSVRDVARGLMVPAETIRARFAPRCFRCARTRGSRRGRRRARDGRPFGLGVVTTGRARLGPHAGEVTGGGVRAQEAACPHEVTNPTVRAAWCLRA